MRIVFLDWLRDPGKPLGTSGMSDIVWSMSRRLAAAGDRATVLAPYRAGELPPLVRRSVQLVHAPVPRILYRNIVGHTLIVLRLRAALLRQRDADVVHVMEYLSSGLIAPTYARAAVVITVPGNIFQRLAHGTNPFDRLTTEVFKRAARSTASHCGAVVATSEEMREWWRRTGTPEHRLVTVPLGVETDTFYPRTGARERLGMSSQEQAVLYVGHLRADNGLENALRAVARVAAGVPHLALHVVGTGPEGPSLQRLAERLAVADRVRWHGWRPIDDLPDLYSAADVLLFPRLAAVTARVVLQAMACRTPVLTSRIGGTSDFVTEGETGLLADPHDVDELAAKLADLLQRPAYAKRLGAAGHEFVRDTLSWDVIVPRLRERVYAPLSLRTWGGPKPEPSWSP